MPRPAVDPPVWATDLNYTSPPKAGTPTKSDPGAGKRVEGWLPEEQPPPQEFNHDENARGQWLQYLEKQDFMSLLPIEPTLYTTATITAGQLLGIASRLQQPVATQLAMLGAHSGSKVLLRSDDGVTWQTNSNPGDFIGIEHPRSMIFSVVAGLWIIGTKTGSTDLILTAADPTGAFTVRTDPSIGAGNHGGMAESATHIIMPVGAETIQSTNGTAWASNGFAGKAAIWSPTLDRFITVGLSVGVRVQSINGDATSHTDQSGNLPGSLAGVDFNDCAWDPKSGLFIIVGDGGKIAVSPNGTTTWTDKSIDGDLAEDITSIVSDGAGTLYMATANHLLRSTDGGATWLVRRQPSFLRGSAIDPAVTYHTDRLIVVGQSDKTTHAGMCLGGRGGSLLDIIVA
ncbi:hypothetical protein LCGC14_0375540 [marine sediment metagenome]|uniref:Photosynthesis system II assembly factor Ycf48/Hcf136-like domain-containing protein n=1 Tax=marine sediment metagenome TaxID=412755 RepID=A0A0F9TM47_9ZZZZ